MHKQAGPYFPIRRPRRGSGAYRSRIVTRCTHVSYPRRITLPESVQFATNTSSSLSRLRWRIIRGHGRSDAQ